MDIINDTEISKDGPKVIIKLICNEHFDERWHYALFWGEGASITRNFPTEISNFSSKNQKKKDHQIFEFANSDLIFKFKFTELV